MVDPLVAKGTLVVVKYAAGKALALWKDNINRNTTAMQEADAADGRRFRAERDHQLQQRLAGLEGLAAEQAEVAEKMGQAVETLLSDDQFFRLERNYEFEAAREATDERRRMLAFAAAWSVDPELSVAELARVERTIRELDPADVDVLKKLAEQQENRPPKPRGPSTYDHNAQTEAFEKHHENMYVGWQGYRPAGEILPAAGCVYIAPKATNYSTTTARLEVTRLGINVLRVLDGYIRSNQPDDAAEGPTT